MSDSCKDLYFCPSEALSNWFPKSQELVYWLSSPYMSPRVIANEPGMWFQSCSNPTCVEKEMYGIPPTHFPLANILFLFLVSENDNNNCIYLIISIWNFRIILISLSLLSYSMHHQFMSKWPSKYLLNNFLFIPLAITLPWLDFHK